MDNYQLNPMINDLGLGWGGREKDPKLRKVAISYHKDYHREIKRVSYLFTGRCIPVLWLCDGRPDCDNHQDEFNCAESCGNDEYLCPTDKRCIPQTWRCNGSPDCANGEDEKLCDCSLNQFKCHTGGCVSRDEICDGIEHCPDRSDEWDCLFNNSHDRRNLTGTERKENEEDGSSTSQPNQLDSLLKIR